AALAAAETGHDRLESAPPRKAEEEGPRASMSETKTLEFEAEGETVGEAKWLALRELEKLQPALDRSAVVFEILSEGERGLLGVGRSPARVLARVPAAAVAVFPRDESEAATEVRELLERIADAAGVRCRVQVSDDGETVTGLLMGADLGLLI